MLKPVSPVWIFETVVLFSCYDDYKELVYNENKLNNLNITKTKRRLLNRNPSSVYCSLAGEKNSLFRRWSRWRLDGKNNLKFLSKVTYISSKVCTFDDASFPNPWPTGVVWANTRHRLRSIFVAGEATANGANRITDPVESDFRCEYNVCTKTATSTPVAPNCSKSETSSKRRTEGVVSEIFWKPGAY